MVRIVTTNPLLQKNMTIEKYVQNKIDNEILGSTVKGVDYFNLIKEEYDIAKKNNLLDFEHITSKHVINNKKIYSIYFRNLEEAKRRIKSSDRFTIGLGIMVLLMLLFAFGSVFLQEKGLV